MTDAVVHGKLYIDGQWREAAGGNTFTVYDKANGAVVGTMPAAGAADTEAAIAAAAAAFPAWKQRSAYERAAVLQQAAQLMLERQEQLARLMTREQGKPLAEARGEVAYAASFFTWFAEEAKRVYGETIPATTTGKRLLVLKQPIGVVAAITPWNFPLAMITRKLGPALAAGCTVVLKPAEQTPLSAHAIVEILVEAGLPGGVVNLVTGDPQEIGPVLTGSPIVRKLTFTGSTEVGKLLMQQAAGTMKRLSLELGGHAPFIVFADADLDAAAAGAIASKYRNAGQTCICANRLYVEESVAAEFAEKLAARVRALKIGHGLDDGVQIGPLIDRAALDKVNAHVEDAVQKGAKVLTGGQQANVDGPGCFYTPTVLYGTTPDMLVMNEETFGPVLPITTFATEDEALQLANDSPYGLAAYFYTENLARAWRVAEALEYGIIGCNDPVPSTAQAPFGGMKESGVGREGGRQGLEEFLETKYVSLGI